MLFCFTLSLPSRLVPTTFTKGGGGGGSAGPLAISKTVVPVNVKFCRVLETPLNFLEILNLFARYLLDYHSISSKKNLSKKSIFIDPGTKINFFLVDISTIAKFFIKCVRNVKFLKDASNI